MASTGTSETIALVAPQLTAAERLDKFILDHRDKSVQVSRSKIQKVIEQGKCKINGQVAKKNSKVKTGDSVVFELEADTGPKEIAPTELPLTIVFEDDHLLVINKAPGVAVHPGAGEDNKITLVHALLHKYGAAGLSSLGGAERPGIVHRLDMDTSGLLILCKTDAAHKVLFDDFQQRAPSLSKVYYAAVLGKFADTNTGSVSSRIMRHQSQRNKMTTTSDPAQGKEALTEFQVEKTWAGPKNTFFSLLRVKIHTGRTHQIRVHLSSISHPIVGDAIYTRNHGKHGVDWLLLVAKELKFTHPITKEALVFEVPFPPHFQGWIDQMNLQEARLPKRE